MSEPNLAQRIRDRLDTWAMPGVKWLPMMSGITEDGHLADFEAYLAKAREFDPADGPKPFEQMRAALLAILDLHKPHPVNDRPPYCDQCVGGYEGVEEWPCPTVRLIAKQLGIEVDGG